MPCLFTPFAHVNPSSVLRSQSGSGLGLSICKRLVTAMGGTISVRTNSAAGPAELLAGSPAHIRPMRKGCGSTFTVQLPLEESDSLPSSGEQQLIRAAGVWLPSDPVEPLSPLHSTAAASAGVTSPPSAGRKNQAAAPTQASSTSVHSPMHLALRVLPPSPAPAPAPRQSASSSVALSLSSASSSFTPSLTDPDMPQPSTASNLRLSLPSARVSAPPLTLTTRPTPSSATTSPSLVPAAPLTTSSSGSDASQTTRTPGAGSTPLSIALELQPTPAVRVNSSPLPAHVFPPLAQPSPSDVRHCLLCVDDQELVGLGLCLCV
jgi:hypothetical protein